VFADVVLMLPAAREKSCNRVKTSPSIDVHREDEIQPLRILLHCRSIRV
jgi:hypothetical protein